MDEPQTLTTLAARELLRQAFADGALVREAVEALPPRARVSFLQGVFEGMSVHDVVVLREENAVLRRKLDRASRRQRY